MNEELKKLIDKAIEEDGIGEVADGCLTGVICKVVYLEGGYEGGGEYVECVLHFPEYETYVQFTGSYYSYDGTNWDDEYTEVHPKEKVVTVYE